MMHRRGFVGALASGLTILRSAAEAQPVAKVYRIGFLLGATGESVASLFHALKDGLRELGYVEGRNIVFVQRYGDGKMERLPDLAAELVRVKVDVIVTGTNLHVAAVRHATSTIPVVMVFAADPVGAGFIASLARPGGNVTGTIARSGCGASFVSAVIEECTRVVTAVGYPPPADTAGLIRGLFSQPDSTYGPSILIDMEDGRPTEGEHTIGDLVERAARAGVSTPILSAALCNLQAYEINRSNPR